MMKLEDIKGLSPRPWSLESNGVLGVDCVMDGDGKLLTGITKTANGRLFMKSADMYECLMEAVVLNCATCVYKGEKMECHRKSGCPAKRWRKVLELASGERKSK